MPSVPKDELILPPEPPLGELLEGRTDPGTGPGDDLADEFADMALKLHQERSLAETVERVLEYALESIPCAHAGIVFLQRGERLSTMAASHEEIARLDEIQLAFREGPDLRLLGGIDSVMVSDTAYEPRWPRWAKEVADVGIGSMMGARLHTADETIGSLNFYAVPTHAFTANHRRAAMMMARHAGVALAWAREHEGIWDAIESRHLIGQAQGLLMERYDVSADTAFSILKRYSQHSNTKLRLVAQQLVETRQLPDLPARPEQAG